MATLRYYALSGIMISAHKAIHVLANSTRNVEET